MGCIATLNVTNTECHAPIRDKTALSIWIPVGGFFVLLFIPLRLYTRLLVTKQQLDWDDWTAIVLGVS